MERQHFILIISSPSGAGKTTVCKKLLLNNPDLKLSISVTTREKRPNEIDKQDYFFITNEQFDKMVQENELLEHAKVFEKNYGTPKKMVEETLKSNCDILFDIDWQGAKQIKQKMKNNCVSIFILPPSIQELKKRLLKRNEDKREIIKLRMKGAKEEIKHYSEYDYIIINENIDKCSQQIQEILNSERIKRTNFSKFVKKILD